MYSPNTIESHYNMVEKTEVTYYNVGQSRQCRLVSITDLVGESELLLLEGSVETITSSLDRLLSFTTSSTFIDLNAFSLDNDKLLLLKV